MSTGPRFAWGGKRPGAGSKVVMIKGGTALVKALEARTKVNDGITIDDLLVGMAYDDEVPAAVRLAAIRTIKEALAKQEAIDAEEKSGVVKPQIFLPYQNPDPAM